MIIFIFLKCLVLLAFSGSFPTSGLIVGLVSSFKMLMSFTNFQRRGESMWYSLILFDPRPLFSPDHLMRLLVQVIGFAKYSFRDFSIIWGWMTQMFFKLISSALMFYRVPDPNIQFLLGISRLQSHKYLTLSTSSKASVTPKIESKIFHFPLYL